MPLPENLSPIFISSPLGRSGTTLLQRLICSSDNGICYGESLAQDFLNYFEYFSKRLQGLEAREKQNAEYWEAILNGRTDFWMPGLELPGGAGKQALLNAALQVPLSAAQMSNELGRPIWAIKKPTVGLDSLIAPMRYLSSMNVIYIYRDPFDTLRSYKARGWLDNLEKVAEYARLWVINTAFIEVLGELDDHAKARLHVVRYEDFVADTEKGVDELCDFADLDGVSHEAADVKINSFSPTHAERAIDRNYVEPEPLTDEEIGIIADVCADRLAALYPERCATPAA
ncbi:sulfotransferase [Tepidicaulis sp. LMO-SS28]|uniref:sulfotransferase n=1 Tax=Tepidicaulis sp. LMO-SS28 TaxID=3447455 RepID=UPI003EE0A1A3